MKLVIFYRFFLYICGFLGAYIFTLSYQQSLNKWNIIQEILVYIIYAWVVVHLSSMFARRLFRISISLLLFVPILSILALELLSFSIQGQSFNDVFFFHARIDVINTGFSVYWKTVIIALSFVFLFPFLDIILFRLHTYSQPFRLINIVLYGILLASITLLLPNALKRFVTVAQDYYSIDSNANFVEVSKKLESYGVKTSALSQTNIEVTAPPQPKNLVIIYLESLERSYTNEKVFPNLIPNIIELQKSSLDFTNLEQLPGTGWTIAGQIASLCGVSLVESSNDFIYRVDSILKVNCLSDILHYLNYEQVFIHGAKLTFAGTGTFFNAHHYNEILGYDEIVTPKILTEKYTKNWGLYDDTLFEVAQKKYHELAAKNQPFVLTLATIDSHPPKGEPSKSCPNYNSNSTILNAVHCTDYLLGQFIKNIKESPAYKNTLIVILSDHLAMKNDADHLYPKNIADRKLLAFVLNSEYQKKIDISGAHFDISHTILDLMEIKTNNNFFLGQSLLQPIQVERYKIFTKESSLIKQFFYLIDESRDIQICDNDAIYISDIDKKEIKLGNLTVTMSYNGFPSLPMTHLFIVKATKEGKIKQFGSYAYNEAMEIIKNDPKALYFILTRNKNLKKIGIQSYWDTLKLMLNNFESIYFIFTSKGLIPFGVGNNHLTLNNLNVSVLLEPDDWLWYLGSPTEKKEITGALANLNDFKISEQTCKTFLSQLKNVH
jgi:phosphoglycerol transferase MdoB-like AlkP superfamily enzyme